MLSSYFQAPIPVGSLFVGEVDLFGEVRPSEPRTLSDIAAILDPGQPTTSQRQVDKVFVSQQNIDVLRQSLAEKGSNVRVQALSTLESLVKDIWPDAIGPDEDEVEV